MMYNNSTCTGCPWPNDPDCNYCQTPAEVKEDCRKIAFKRRCSIDREKAKAEKVMLILQVSINRRSLKDNEKETILRKINNATKKVHQTATVTIPLYHYNIGGNKLSDIKEKLQKIIADKQTFTEDICLCKRILSAFELATYYNGYFVSAWQTDHGINVKFSFFDKNSLEKFKNDWSDM